MSLGSANETAYFLLLSKDLNYMGEDKCVNLERNIESIKAMLISLIVKVKSCK
jgi:four helix bundle protein